MTNVKFLAASIYGGGPKIMKVGDVTLYDPFDLIIFSSL